MAKSLIDVILYIIVFQLNGNTWGYPVGPPVTGTYFSHPLTGTFSTPPVNQLVNFHKFSILRRK